jgi:hypothetical protein
MQAQGLGFRIFFIIVVVVVLKHSRLTEENYLYDRFFGMERLSNQGGIMNY